MHYCLLYRYNLQHKTLKRLWTTILFTPLNTVQSAKPLKSSEVHQACWCSVLNDLKHSFNTKENHILFAWHSIQHVYVQCYISKWKKWSCMEWSGVSDVDLCSVSCPWEKERLSCFQLIMLSSISRVHAHKWHFQECGLNLQRTKNRGNNKTAHNYKERS